MGLYYSYYKTLIEASDLTEGMYKITHDNLTEYPSTINTVQRFTLYPEIFVAGFYRLYMSVMEYMELPTKQCWRVERGQNLLPVMSCEGLGDPMFFYVHIVWLMSGMTTMVMFAYGTFISESVAGGFLSVLCFFFNHGECTRVQFAPPLRESFAYPLFLWHMFTVTAYLTFLVGKENHQVNTENKDLLKKLFKGSSILLIVWMCGCTVAPLVTWQFSQFVLAIEAAAVFAMYALRVVNKYTLVVIMLGQGVGVTVAILALYGNVMLICSVYTCLLICVLVFVLILEPIFMRALNPSIRPFLAMALVVSLTVGFKIVVSQWLDNQDDGHILNLLLSKFTDYKDFHTLLYTCSEEFDFLPAMTLHKMTSTLLIPSVIVSLLLVNVYWLRTFLDLDVSWNGKRKKSSTFPAILFNTIMLVPFTVMAVLMMRLKLFFSPHLCVMTALLASRKCFWFLNRQEIHWTLIALLISGMSITGLKNLNEQHSIVGEYSNVELEELLLWVNSTTSRTAVFAGPMSVMANLMLSTRRPVVNHPHYESADLRRRTLKVYSTFSRKRAEEVYTILASMQVNYVVLEDSWCFRRPGIGCSLVDLWDTEDPDNRHRPPLCPSLVLKDAAPFQKVFINDMYVVLHLGAQYVELTMREYKI
ncbi:protein C-mannosyl-transferase DPY19L1 isoform X2 [Bacillus rossius redtenbacheri]